MTDINKVMPKIPHMRWGALMNKAPTNNKVKELNKISYNDMVYQDYINCFYIPVV